MRPRPLPASVLLLALILTSTAASCPPQTASPEQRAAHYANEAVLKIGEIQSAAISANAAGALTDRHAVTVVRFTTASVRTIRQTPFGWAPLVKTAYTEVKLAVPAPPGSALATTYAVLDALFTTIQTGAP